jgi:hypothetical protein
MPYRIAGIDVPKKMLAVVMADVEVVLNQAANAAVKAKGTIFAVVYRRLVPRLGHAQAIGAITHRLCRLIWKILHERVRYEERGPAVSAEAKKVRAIARDFRPWLIPVRPPDVGVGPDARVTAQR